MTEPALTGKRCQCPTCKLIFTNERAFDLHRVGSYGVTDDPRRCLAASQMHTRGLYLRESGVWGRTKPAEIGQVASPVERKQSVPAPSLHTPTGHHLAAP